MLFFGVSIPDDKKKRRANYSKAVCSVGFVCSGYGHRSLAELSEVPRVRTYGCESFADLTEVPGRCTNVVPVLVPTLGYFYKGIPVPRELLCHGRTELTEVPGKGMNVVENLQKFRVRYPRYGSLRTLQNTTFSLTEFPDTGMYRRYTELTEAPGTGMEVLQNLQNLRVGMRMLHPYPYLHSGMMARAYPYPGYCATGVQKAQNFRVRA